MKKTNSNNCIEFPQLALDTPTHDDLQEIAQVLNRNWHQTYDKHLPRKLLMERTPATFESLLQSRNLENTTIARLGNKIIGYSDHLSNCVDNLWVDTEFQRRGIGRKLLNSQVEKLRLKNMHSVQAGCESFNSKAVSFYENSGWHVIDDALETIVPGFRVGIIVYGYDLQ